MSNVTKPQILIARAIFPEVIARLEKHFTLELNQEDYIFSGSELAARLQGKFGMLCTSSARIDTSLLAACPDLRIVSSLAVGYDNIDLVACQRFGVMATNAPDVLSETTADYAWALMMAAARRVTEAEHFLRAGLWQKWSCDFFLGAEIHGRCLGILGMGRIGQAIARRASGFGMRVIYHNRRRLTPEQELAAHGATYVDKEGLLRESDHLMLALPYTPEARHIIAAPELALMKPSATLCNIARGGVVDDQALIAALREGRLAAAGLDVFENEPRFHPDFLKLNNVVLSPHIASATLQTRLAMANTAANNLIAAARGERPPQLLVPYVRCGNGF